MKKSNFARLIKLIKRYQAILWAAIAIFAITLSASLWIYYHFEGQDHPKENYWFQLADFLMDVSKTVLGTILIGGGLGGIINFIFEEQKNEEEAIKGRWRSMQESKEKRRQFRGGMRNKLQKVYDEVALARILIQSHQSARTYGEQIRDRIMPGNIVLQDLKRQLIEFREEAPIEHLRELEVSITYMSAYLSVLIEEFAQHYLDIANLQNYQDVLATRRRAIFAETLENIDSTVPESQSKKVFLKQTDQLFKDHEVPDRMAVVWKAMKRLDYVWDFIDDLRNLKGETSLYQNFFIDHHFHCLRLLRDKDAKRNEKICQQASFQRYLKEHARLLEKKNSDQAITKNDSLTRRIMVEGLEFDFEKMARKG